MPALTRDEAVARRALIDVTSYEVDLDLADAESAPAFVTTSVIGFTCSAPGSGTFVDLKADELLGADLNGVAVDPRGWVDGRLALEGLAADNVLHVRSRITYSRTGEGIHRFVDPEDGLVYAYSQGGAHDTPRIYACFEQPDLKAPFTVTVTAPPAWTVLGNGAGTQVRPGRWELATTAPMSTYLVAVVAGPYTGVHETHDGVDLGVWCRASLAPHLDVERVLETTRRGLDYFQDLFGSRYPFGKYDQVMVPELNWGAMENPGVVTFRDELFVQRGTVTAADREGLARTQLHEMAHMWFGNLVTMQWWDDLWLNESFADYMGYRAAAETTEHVDSWLTFLVQRKVWGYRADQLSTTHPIAGEGHDTTQALLNFDGISYAKGAAALRQLVAWVGDDAFIAAVRAHFAEHAFANATLADLVRALSASSGRDVSTWAEQWLRTSGVSTLSADTTTDADGRYTRFAVRQRSDRPRPHRIGIGLYDDVDGALMLRRRVVADVAAEDSSPVGELVGELSPDLLLPNDGDLTFALLDLDDRSLATVRSRLRDLRDPVARALVWTTTWEMVGQGRLAPSAFVDLVVTGLTEDEPALVAQTTLARAAVCADLLASDARRAHVMARLADFAHEEAERAEPGSDRQLELVRTHVRLSEDGGLLRDWLDGRGVLTGLNVDPDLRWRLLRRLVTLGLADDADITAEGRRDRSSSGGLQAMTALAAVPSAAAKEQAWSRALAGELSNHELTAVGTGFWQRTQADLLEPYVERFARDYPAVSARQSTQLVHTFGQLLFPRTRVDPGTVLMAQGLLDDDGLAASARRAVAEARDDVERALRSRAADASA